MLVSPALEFSSCSPLPHVDLVPSFSSACCGGSEHKTKVLGRQSWYWKVQGLESHTSLGQREGELASWDQPVTLSLLGLSAPVYMPEPWSLSEPHLEPVPVGPRPFPCRLCLELPLNQIHAFSTAQHNRGPPCLPHSYAMPWLKDVLGGATGPSTAKTSGREEGEGWGPRWPVYLCVLYHSGPQPSTKDP